MSDTFLSDEQVLRFSRAWAWISSDRVGEFDDDLHRPIAAISAMQAHTRVLIEKCESIEPNDSVVIRLKYFREMLSSLEDAGENIQKIYDWARSLSEFMQELNAVRSMQVWVETFGRFVRGQSDPARYIAEDVLKKLVESFLREVHQPQLYFRKKVWASQKDWLSSRGRRTEFDELLWVNYFAAYEVDPGNIVSLGYREMLVREWWRVIRRSLSEKQILQLRCEQIENTRVFAKSRIPTWKIDNSVDESMVCRGFPVFETLRP